MRVARVVAPLLVLLVAACGTTVPSSQRASLGSAGGLGAAQGAGAGTDAAPDGGSALVPGSATAAAGTAAGPAAAGAAGPVGPAATSTRVGSAPLAAAADRTPVRVGFELIKGGNAAISAAFGTPVNFGDGRTEVTAIVDDVNAHGGLAGRKILPFFAEWDVTSKDAGREAVCRALAEDDKVSFILTVVNMSQSFVSCAKKHGVPVVNASFGAGDETIYQQYGDYLFSPALLNLDRELRLVLQTAKDSGRISPSTKVGVVVDGVEDPQYARVYSRSVDPLLTRWGVPHESFTVVQQSDVSGAVLRFNSDGVKTVFFVAPSGVIEVLFLQTAEQQRYRPAYGLGDSTDPWFISSASPAAQAQGIFGAGSLPISDVATDQYPTTAREKRCLDLIRAKGESNADRHSSITATVYCEAVYAFAAVGSRVSGRLTAASFRAAYPTVTGYQPVTTFATDFGNGRHDNAAQYRLLGWSGGCSCVRYLSGSRALPR